jgi:hypothetical protein
MKGVTLISTVELLQEGVHRANRRSNLHLTNRSVIVLVVVYKACIASGGISQHQICNRLEKTHNQASEMASVGILYRLCLLGLLSKKKEGKAFIYRVTVAGSNYIKMFERTLREVRQKF